MRNLHGVTPSIPTAIAWFMLMGQRWRELDQGRSHLYEIPRGKPPEPPDPHIQDEWMTERMHRRRRMWVPFSFNTHNPAEMGIDVLMPMCGNRIATRSNGPRLSEVGDWHHNHCQACLALAAQGITANLAQMRRQDPWMQMSHDERSAMLDPLSLG